RVSYNEMRAFRIPHRLVLGCPITRHRQLCALSIPWILLILTIAVASRPAHAVPRVQFSRQILPLLRKECGVCHAGPAAPNGYSMETSEKLLAGGRHGAAILPGRGAQSNLIRYLKGELQPQMP